MKLRFYFLVKYSIIIILSCGTIMPYLLNYTDLMKSYYLLCGSEYFCFAPDKTHGWKLSPNLSYKHLNVCPECQCDDYCIKRGDCCADLYFSFPHLNCVNRTIINGRYEKDQTEQYSALMVESCPDGSSEELTEKCKSLNDTKVRLKIYPVTGNKVPLTFYNKFCAECNNVLNYTQWTLDINCSVFADFNYLSTLDDVIDMAFERKCIFQTYKKDNESEELKEENCFDVDESQSVITKCNQTSEWVTYDQSIVYACESYFKGKYRLFKNIFCYMCNPSGLRYMTQTIKTCNITGQWNIYDDGLYQACTDLPMIISTAPFKNIFCYLCNRGNNSSQMFVDIIGKLSEIPIEDTHFHYQYDLDILDFNLQYFMHKSTELLTENKDLNNVLHTPFDISSFKVNSGTLINMTNLLLQNSAISTVVPVCESRLSVFPQGYGSSGCECDILCFYRDSPWVNCCKDLALQVPLYCKDILDLSHSALPRSRKEGFLTMNGCFQEKTNKLISSRCSFPEEKDVFSTIPLNSDKGIIYNNFYCTLCNFDSDKFMRRMQGLKDVLNYSIDDVFSKSDDLVYRLVEIYQSTRDKFAIWNLEMVCPKYLDYSHNLVAGEIIHVAKQSKCRMRYRTRSSGSRYCPPGRSAGRCANVGGWTYSDKDVQWGCENVITYKNWWARDLPSDVPGKFDLDPKKHYRKTGVYSNILCALCRPMQTFQEFFVDNCTVSGSADACYKFPRTYYFYPFKNIYCLLCNDLLPIAEKAPIQERELEMYNRIVGLNWFPMLRNLFSISEDEATLDPKAIGQCSSKEVYDPFQVDKLKRNFDDQEGHCRNITCYSGKYLDGETCKALFAVTMNLKYWMTFEVGLYTLKGHVSYIEYPKPVQDIVTELNEFLSLTNGKSKADLWKFEKFDRGPGVSTALCMTLSYEILFESSVSRTFVEQSLVDFKSRLSGGCDQNITSSNITERTEMFSSTEKKRRSVGKITDLLFSAKVSKTLLCPQIELDDDEYNISSSNLTLVLTREGFLNINISMDEFAFTPDGKMRLCLSYLRQIRYLPAQQKARTVLEDLKQKYLWIMSLVASSISIISLSLGLIIYCTFATLRTIPGTLLMVMMVSLLLTLFFLQISFFVAQTRYGCFVVAVVLHFLWISVFTSMQTSCFHMWRSFTSKNIPAFKRKRALFWYIIYTLSTAIIFVLLNLLLSWIMYSNPFEGYGGGKCFIRNIYMLVALFVCPVGLICLFNLLLFSLTIYSIKTIPSADNNQQKRNEMAIFARLATITGLSWVLQIVDSFLPLTYFTFVATIINSLQGFLIFIAFVLNKRVWNLLRDKLPRGQNNNRPLSNGNSDKGKLQTKHSKEITLTSSTDSIKCQSVSKIVKTPDLSQETQSSNEFQGKYLMKGLEGYDKTLPPDQNAISCSSLGQAHGDVRHGEEIILNEQLEQSRL